jgi:hypothetical protein
MKKTYHITPRESSSGKFYFVASIAFLLFWAILLLMLLHSEYRPLFGVILCLGLLGPILYFLQLLFASFYIVLEEDKLTVANYFIPCWGGCYPLQEIKHVLFWFGPGVFADPYFRVHLQNGKRSSFRSLSALIPKERLYEFIYDLHERGIAVKFSHARFYPNKKEFER